MSGREAFAVGGEQWVVSDDTIKLHLTEPLMHSIFSPAISTKSPGSLQKSTSQLMVRSSA